VTIKISVITAAKVVWHLQQMFKMSVVCSDTSTGVLRPYTPFLHLLAGWGTSSPRARDGKPRAADMRDTRFHTLIAEATQQSGSKSCGLYCMGRALGESIGRRSGLWRSYSSVLWRSMNAQISMSSTMQWSSGVSASVLVSLQTENILNICCECCTAFAVNGEFYCHTNS